MYIDLVIAVSREENSISFRNATSLIENIDAAPRALINKQERRYHVWTYYSNFTHVFLNHIYPNREIVDERYSRFFMRVVWRTDRSVEIKIRDRHDLRRYLSTRIVNYDRDAFLFTRREMTLRPAATQSLFSVSRWTYLSWFARAEFIIVPPPRLAERFRECIERDLKIASPAWKMKQHRLRSV